MLPTFWLALSTEHITAHVAHKKMQHGTLPMYHGTSAVYHGTFSYGSGYKTFLHDFFKKSEAFV